MGNFRPQGRGGGFNRGRDRGFGGDRGFNRDRGDRRNTEMFDVVCSKCGKDCQVPFKPTGNKPVFCSDCFSKQEDRGNRNGSNSENSEELKQINIKLDKIISILQELELDVEADDSDSSEEN